MLVFKSDPNKKIQLIIVDNIFITKAIDQPMIHATQIEGDLEFLEYFNTFTYTDPDAVHIVAKSKNMLILCRNSKIANIKGADAQIELDADRLSGTNCIEISDYQLYNTMTTSLVKVKAKASRSNFFMKNVKLIDELELDGVAVIDVNGGNADAKSALTSANTDLPLAGITTTSVTERDTPINACSPAVFQNYLLNLDVPQANADQFAGTGQTNGLFNYFNYFFIVI